MEIVRLFFVNLLGVAGLASGVVGYLVVTNQWSPPWLNSKWRVQLLTVAAYALLILWFVLEGHKYILR